MTEGQKVTQFLVLADRDVGEFYLATEPVILLFVGEAGEKVLRPRDEIHFGPGKCGTVTAADLVLAWLRQSKRIPEAQRAAAEFLRQS